jgi:hypothetical protein
VVVIKRLEVKRVAIDDHVKTEISIEVLRAGKIGHFQDEMIK